MGTCILVIKDTNDMNNKFGRLKHLRKNVTLQPEWLCSIICLKLRERKKVVFITMCIYHDNLHTSDGL